ncbi:MAG: class I SAM-dependent methyltransferase [Magnetococcales bacterium]|nr:class I SAM-dependent methyltransferase [Magnetococcales bacterium]
MPWSVFPVVVTTDDTAFVARAQEQADRLGLPWMAWEETASRLVLRVAATGLELLQRTRGCNAAVRVDFSTAIARARQQEGIKQSLARAVGIKSGIRPLVLDATPGLGRDAFVLAALGCQVIMVERSLVVHALLADGLERAQKAGVPVCARLSLIAGDARDYLTACHGPMAAPEVIYLDPMHPERHKSALVKKEMRHLRLLVGDDPDAASLLPLARACARQRVVVKRPKVAPPLADMAADQVLAGHSTRYDLYFSHQSRS